MCFIGNVVLTDVELREDALVRPPVQLLLCLAKSNIDITLFLSIDHNDSLSLTCILYTSILTFAHFSRFTHIYNNNTSTLYHLAWEFKKPFIISFITLRFIQPKISELLISQFYCLSMGHSQFVPPPASLPLCDGICALLCAEYATHLLSGKWFKPRSISCLSIVWSSGWE